MGAVDVLRSLEWSGEHGQCPTCRACRRCAEADGRPFEGHTADCELSAVLASNSVTLRGLTKGGEWADADAYSRGMRRSIALVLAADGQIVNCHPDAADAMVRGAVPLTWYTQITPPG